MLILGASRPLRIICAREFQNSIEESVHRLLEEQIEPLGLQGFYDVEKRKIYGRNGTDFSFLGIRININKIKSFEGADIVWVEEGQSVSDHSWHVLIPTIRKAGSEIWISYNPDLEEDPTHQRFVKYPPTSATVVKVNWSDNPWFPEILREEMIHLKERDHAAWLNVWEGECRSQVANPLWTKEIINQNREPIWDDEAGRLKLMASMKRIVVAVDPSGCSGPDDARSDEIGIVVAGLGYDGIARILEDASGRYSPDGWAQRAVEAFDRWKADKIVAEKNYGGAMVASNIRTARASAPVKEVDASRGKKVRAEPVAALFEQGKVRLVGFYAEMERQFCLFSTDGYKGAKSPDRADAGVWAITELMLGETNTGVLDYYAQEAAKKEAREAEQWLRGRQFLDHEGKITPLGRNALATDPGTSWAKGARGMLEGLATAVTG